MKKVLAIAAVMLLGSSGAWALTAAGVDINNSASLTYSVNGHDQTNGGADPVYTDQNDTFKVDRKIDLTVANQDTNKTVDVTPGQTDATLTFIVKNTGNDTETFDLTTIHADGSNGASSDYTISTCAIKDGGSDITDITLAADANKTLTVVCTIPSATDDQNASLWLNAQAQRAEDNANPDVASTVQTVYADAASAGGYNSDGQYNGGHSDIGTYHVKTASMSASKSSCVIWDPVNGNISAGNNPKRIPGAVVRYAIDVSNSGSDDADSVTLSDELQSDIEWGATTTGAPAPVALIATETCNCTSPGADNGDNIDHNNATPDVVTASFGTVTANTHECAYFDVTIK